ncbi:hypothetical protein IAU60_001038 [Kwoniella sp. DSM 27419]
MSTLATASLSSDEEDDDFIPTVPKSKSKLKPAVKRKVKDESSKTKRERRAGRGTGKVGEGDDGGASGSDTATSSSESGSGSGSEDDSDGDGEQELEREREAKRAKRVEDEVAERRRRAREEFERMKSGDVAVAGPSDSGGSSKGQAGFNGPVGERMEVRRARRFAGETIYETVMLRSDDPEAIAYMAKQQAASDAVATTRGGEAATKAQTAGRLQGPSSTASITPTEAAPEPPAQSMSDKAQAGHPSSAAITAPSASHTQSTSISSTPVTASTPTANTANSAGVRKPPVRRKPRQSLEAMSAALDKGKKLTTLEKSAMDWTSHTTSDQKMNDELAANRRSGGYLDKRDFLDRVGERRANGPGGAK